MFFFLCKGPQASYSFKFFVFIFASLFSFLAFFWVMDCGSLLIFFTPFILLFLFFPLIFFSSLPLSSFYFPSLTPSKCLTLHLLHLVATCFVTCCSSFSLLSNLLLLPPSIITCYHCLSSLLLDAIAFHYLIPFPLIVTCFIIVPSPFMHVVPTFHHHLFCHCYTYLLSPIAPLLVTQIFAKPTFHCHIIHHFYVTLVVFASSLCSLAITFCPFL